MQSRLELTTAETPIVQAILAWPDYEVDQIRREVLARSTSPTSQGQQSLLQHGLITAGGEWTELGRSVSDLLIHESWQEGDEVLGLLRGYPDLLRGAVLDAGCSTGWTLRQLRHAAWRIGVDVDQEALALGHRLTEAEGEDVEFRHASAHELPFADASFDCVICRNALTYMHQRRALREMTRVLKPGGLLLLRYESALYDLQQVLSARGLKAVCCRLRDLAFGAIHAAIGWQVEPGARLAPGRVLGSTMRLRRYLRSCGCDIKQVVDARQCPRLFGRATQKSLLAHKVLAARNHADTGLLATAILCSELLAQAA